MKKLFVLLIIITPIYSSAQVYDVLTYNKNEGTENGGITIKTQIPINIKLMPLIHIDGQDYGASASFAIDINWYSDESRFVTSNATSSGGLAPQIMLSEVDGKVNICLVYDFYYLRFHLTAFSKGLDEDINMFQDWTVENHIITGNNQIKVAYNNQFKDNLSVNGKLFAENILSGNINSYGNIITDGTVTGNMFTSNHTTNGMQGYFTAFSDNNLSQNAFPTNNGNWQSYGPKSSYGSAVVLQTQGISGKALNILVDTTIGNNNETLSFTNLFTINTNGKAGIGSINPKELLQVNGNIVTSGNNRGYRFNSYDSSGNKYLTAGYAATLILDTAGNLFFKNTSNSGSAASSATLNDVFVIDKDGKVGIGTSTPQSKLAINGDVYAKKVKVTITGWPDYVFEPTYKLPDLEKVEQFILLNKHLPGVQCAKEIEKDGNDIGLTQAVLMQKIEELTLYIIELNKKVEKLTNEKERLRIRNVKKQK